ncbi:hypothetical protein [Roseomonas fluvialis]|uniref:SPOR domain-containing protein n=1 Tax=Roseomonas fluvialis TaxID=1750527 RepID=A0ABM7Y5C1_9PROT|nr:hypothetical protein [Roseomonas fluvialis]BDG73145.1 hypothetical protein Rmf_30740 [Roseomonas fluvialis]
MSARAALVAVGLALAMPALAQPRDLRPHNIYASLDPDRPDQATLRRVQGALTRCGIRNEQDSSVAYEGLRPGIYLVITGPHRSAEVAAAELARARACGIEGYTRMARRRPGVLED